ncbi:MAG: hypothetical protein QGH07_09415, partial [Alphaproteobacteria bacterium]|nr:hypothetical protein [Alphaproteobacteria bacterium]
IYEKSNPRIPRKAGQPAKSKKHSDLYTDEDPKGTIHGLGFKNVAKARALWDCGVEAVFSDYPDRLRNI